MRTCECGKTTYPQPDCLGVDGGHGYNQSCQCLTCATNRGIIALEARNTRDMNSEPDEYVVDAILAGQQMRTNRRERLTLTIHLTRRGLTNHQIARQLGCDPRSVERYRQQLRAEGRM